MVKPRFVLVHWILPLSLIGAWGAAYVFASRSAAAEPADFRDDPRIGIALACTVEDMWPHQEVTKRVSEMGDGLDMDGTPPDHILLAARNGDTDAMFELAVMHLSVSWGDHTEGLRLLRQAAEAGHAMAAGELGAALVYGYYGASADGALGREWLGRAAELGEPYAQFSLAELHASAWSPQTRHAGLDLLLASAAQCFPSASRRFAESPAFRNSRPDFVERADMLSAQVSEFEARGGYVQL